jgi:hypothetical protein
VSLNVDAKILDHVRCLAPNASQWTKTGLGFEAGYLLGGTSKRVLLFYRRDVEKKVSLLITGNTHPNCTLLPYAPWKKSKRSSELRSARTGGKTSYGKRRRNIKFTATAAFMAR